jgi:hypothetical protein
MWTEWDLTETAACPDIAKRSTATSSYARSMNLVGGEPIPRHRPAQDVAERDTSAGVFDFLRATVRFSTLPASRTSLDRKG